MQYHYWNKETARKFLSDLGNKLNIQSHSDWYNVTVSELHQHGGGGLYDKYKTLFNLFSTAYPEYRLQCCIISV